MTTLTEAQKIITSLAKSFGTEVVELHKATGRILAEPIVADRDYPPFNRATMDGYAMNFKDVVNNLFEFVVVETIFAGQISQVSLQSGQCYKIMTGAAVPLSADMIIQRENVVEREGHITVPSTTYNHFQQISIKGEDVKEGESIVEPPSVCTPAVISALAALGKASVKVAALPRVALFTTGNEIKSVGEEVSPFQIRNSNQYMFRALLQKWAVEPFICEHIRDEKTALYDMLSQGLAGDFMIISGGVSAGDADYVPEILAQLGIKKLFHKVAIKPGKPLWCGHASNGTMVFALPGNPFSGLVTFTLFVELYLLHCFGLSGAAAIMLPLKGSHTTRSIQDEFFPIRIDDQSLAAIPLSFNGSGDILAALHADGIAHHPAGADTLSTGTPVHVRLFRK